MRRYDSERASANLGHLSSNNYPGRGIVMGRTNEFDVVQIYWIMGRSENSRNRVFGKDENGRVFTEAADPSKVTDPRLIIYNAMLERAEEDETRFIVSNGDQTDTVFDTPITPLSLALRSRDYEPDPPNHTARITGVYTQPRGKFEFSVIRRGSRNTCDRLDFRYESIPRGLGYCVHTYMGDGTPLPSWEGEPCTLPISGTRAEDIAEEYWKRLNPQNRVSLVVKLIDTNGGVTIEIINKHERVSA